MKKRLFKIFTLIFGFALILTGCATVSNIKNESKEILYYGGSAVTVGDYTYFANAYTPYSDAKNFDYKGNSQISYLARVKTQDLKADNGKDFSPNLVEKVCEKVVGYQNESMFVLGDYIYFTSMNTHKKTKPIENDYSLITLWRCALNGDGLTEIYTSDHFGSDAKFAPVGDLDNGYYWLCWTGAYSEENQLSGRVYSVDLSNKAGKAKLIAEKAVTAVFADVNEDGNLDKVLYTTVETKASTSQTMIYGVDYSGENKVAYNNNERTFNLIDKVEDVIFYTDSDDANQTFYRNIENIQKDEKFDNGEKTFVVGSASDIRLISKDDAFKGYLYKGASENIMYKRANQDIAEKLILKKSQYSDILFVDGEYVYYSSSNSEINSNTNTIARISCKPLSGSDETKPQSETMVTMTSLQTGKFGADKNYIYFYAKLEDVELELKEGEEKPTDDNLYMYRVRKGGGNYQLLGKTVNERKPKVEE